MASVLEVNNETKASRSRTTKNGRKITYFMEVVQQPERARACGQGAKSSTDRRPVDPPPIIRLLVYEGEGENATDVTFSYRANFFVWASLEHARPIAQGRVSQGASNTPVLCGTPVAGTSYLERPEKAGYFIFPDLSVRHEGKFRLSFTLYEDLRDPPYEDAEPQSCPVESAVGEYVNGRCEVKSVPFMVYSAKKFPGLTESTGLSRMVADQGCRVRIRRDVRMRRREANGTKDWDDYEDNTAAQRARHATTPIVSTPIVDPNQYPPHPGSHHSRYPSAEPPPPRQRSGSNASNMSVHHQPVHQQVREWNSQEVASPYQQIPPAGTAIQPHPPQHYYRGPPQGAEPTSMPPYQGSPYPAPMPPSPQQISNPHMSPYPMNVPHQHWSYGSQPPMQSPVYGPPAPNLQHPGMGYASSPSEYQPHTGHGQYSNQSHQPAPLPGPESNGYGRPLHQMYPNGSRVPPAPQNPTSYTTNLPPLKTEGSASSFDHGPPNSANPASRPYSTPYPRQPPAQYVSQTQPGAPAQKRPYANVFSTQHIDQPLRAGARPTVNGMAGTGFEGQSDHSSSDEESLELERLKMEYRRADGTKVHRMFPSIT